MLETDNMQDDKKTITIAALHQVLKPIAKLAMSLGINYQMLSDTLKSVLVEVAEQEFKLDDRDQTDSRISLISGVHRKDVHRLRGLSQPEIYQAASVNFSSHLVAMWINNNQYIDLEGNPKPLAKLTSVGGASSFESLVASVSKDIRSRSVLDEWLRIGAVYLDENDYVCLNKDSFIAKDGFEEKLFFFQHNIHDHIAATTHNVLNEQPPMLERCVYYDGLTTDNIAELNQMAEDMGMASIKKLNKKAMELIEENENKDDADERFTFGIYFFKAKETLKKNTHRFYRRKSTRIDSD
jgi:hypothetical protein